MAVYVIDQSVIEKLREVRIHAEKYPLSIETIKEGNERGFFEGPYAINNFEVIIDVGWRVCFTIEEGYLNNKKVLARHLSVQNSDSEKLPLPLFVKEIMIPLGFEDDLEECHVFRGADHMKHIINVIERYETNPARITSWLPGEA